MPTLVVGMLAVSLRSLGKHGTRSIQSMPCGMSEHYR